ncbi:MAG: nodulation protein NfeD [Candidatus Eremiobacterota bacterium]
MKGGIIIKKILIAFIILLLTSFPVLAKDSGSVYVMKIKGPIGPVTDTYFKRVLEEAKKHDAMCLVVEMDTPGGLMDSMKDIMQKIINSEIPVVVYVSPGGASATSAGVFITLSAHVAAMAPNTNIGAAHPVMIGENGEQQMSKEMKEKITNDSVALIKTTADKKGRNMEWAEKAVRESVSATEKEALQLKVVDLVAANLTELLKSIDGLKIETVKGTVFLKTSGAIIKEIPMSSTEKFLNVLSNPNVAYILIILGTYGLIYELASPMSIFPGVVGGICIILAFFALGTLPVNYAGLALLVFAFILFIIDIKAPTHGILTAGGVISMILGSIFLFNSDLPFYQVSWSIILGVVGTTTVFFVFIITTVLRSHKKKVTTGVEGFTGQKGIVKNPLEPKGQIMLDGALWRAITTGRYVKEGEEVIVKKVDGLTVYVEPYENK